MNHNDNLPTHDATRREQSRFAAGAIPVVAMDDNGKFVLRPAHDAVQHPKHYTSHPSGVECIEITEHMGFNLGNALKYIWRCDLKADAIEDLKKAVWYIEREIAKRSAACKK